MLLLLFEINNDSRTCIEKQNMTTSNQQFYLKFYAKLFSPLKPWMLIRIKILLF